MSADRDEKNTEYLRVYLSEKLLRAVKRVARSDRRDPSEYVRLLLEQHCYGHPALTSTDLQGSDED